MVLPDKPVTLTMTASESYGDTRRLGIYAWDPFRKRWRFVGAEPEAGAGRATAKVRWLQEYALLEDGALPSLGGPTLTPGGPGMPLVITFSLDDSGMGVDDETVRVSFVPGRLSVQ